jgi:sigma-B regulation protein RsbU (phosphoserine phosphatase)
MDRSELPEDSAEDLYDNAPCGYLSTLLDGTITKVNQTLLRWLGLQRADVVGRRRFADLLTIGGKLYHETHFAPLLRLQGEIRGVALELRSADGTRMPVLVTATVKTDEDGDPLLIRTVLLDARDRRAYERELLHARQAADRERERLQDIVAALRASFLPPSLPDVPGLQVAAHYHTASPDQFGGDFYDVFPLHGGQWCFFLGDVCGNGVAAAAVTSLARYTLRADAIADPHPDAILANLNTALYQAHQGDTERYCTAVVGILTRAGADVNVTLASGGHPMPLVLRADGTVDPIGKPGAPLIGVLPYITVTAETIMLRPGDTLVVYTDGLTDARADPTSERYGQAALHDFVTTIAPTTASGAVAAITRLLGSFGDGLDDDAAVLALSVDGPVRS